MPIEFAERTRRIPVYPLAAGYDLGADVAMLASNESCFGPLPSVVEAAARVLAGTNRYPDPAYAPLRRALADRYGIPPQRIALGNGSCDILLAAGEALLEPGAEIVYAWPAFSVYPHLAAASGARAIQVGLDAEDRHDLDAIAAEVTVATRLVLLCNPNNPTSTALGLEEIDAFLERVPGHVCVILDEAYCEFALTLGDTYASLELLRKHPNLVLLRTFSKVYGLAGLRVGYALCGTEDFRVAVDQVRQPFYLNTAAQAAAVEALRHQDEVERRVTETIAERLAMEARARELGLWVARSDANFIWLHLPETIEEADVVSGLRDRRVLVRAGAALGRERSLRVTVGTPAENERFADALAAVLGNSAGV
jgi:histidinol-phosphate aminotransferase